MKNNLILLFCIFIIGNVSYSQDKDCIDRMRTGTFTYMADNALVTVVRTETTQTETFIDRGKKAQVFTKIRWISDNVYIITFLKQKNAKGCLKRGDEMKLTILECDGLTYTARLTSEHCGGAPITTTFKKIG